MVREQPTDLNLDPKLMMQVGRNPSVCVSTDLGEVDLGQHGRGRGHGVILCEGSQHDSVDTIGPANVALHRRAPFGSEEADRVQALAFGRVTRLRALLRT